MNKGLGGINQYSHLARILPLSGKIFACFAGIWLVVEILNYFIPGIPIYNVQLPSLGTFLVIGIISGLIWELLFMQRELSSLLKERTQLEEQNRSLQSQAFDSGSNENETSLLEELRRAYSQRNWEEVIMLGSPLSRPLWLTGRYQLRLHIGSLVEGASTFLGRFDVQASALIDDLGWTSICLRRYNEGINYVLHGLKVAEDNDFASLACRGYRHLAGAYLKLGNLEQSTLNADKSDEWLSKVKDEAERKELEAGLAYHRARELQVRGNYLGALQALISVQEMFVRLSDNDRANKVYGPIGQAYFDLGRLSEAKDAFRRGLETARLSARRDSELVNLLGLAEIAKRESDLTESRRMLNEAAATALYLGIPDKAAEYKEKANMLIKGR